MHCTRGCVLLFHDKCWRPFLEGVGGLRAAGGEEFDRTFKATGKDVSAVVCGARVGRGVEHRGG